MNQPEEISTAYWLDTTSRNVGEHLCWRFERCIDEYEALGERPRKWRALTLLSGVVLSLRLTENHAAARWDVARLTEALSLASCMRLATESQMADPLERGMLDYLRCLPGFDWERSPSEQFGGTIVQHDYLVQDLVRFIGLQESQAHQWCAWRRAIGEREQLAVELAAKPATPELQGVCESARSPSPSRTSLRL